MTSTGEIIGGLGLSPVLSADRQQLTLDLRLDALFANNVPVTTVDVIDSLHWAWAVGMQGNDAWRWQHLEAIVRFGERSVGILLGEPDASILALLSSWRVPIVPSAWMAAIDRTSGIGRHPLRDGSIFSHSRQTASSTGGTEAFIRSAALELLE